MEITYLVEWGKDRTKAWSGTNLGIYNALKKRVEVDDVDITPGTAMKIVTKAAKALRGGKGDMGMLSHKILRAKHNGKAGDVVFQFAEILPDTDRRRTYIYQDLSVSYVEYMAQNLPDTFAVSAFQTLDPRMIHRRTEEQMEYYRTCSGIFTMGRWLAKDLAERCNIPSVKIFHSGGV